MGHQSRSPGSFTPQILASTVEPDVSRTRRNRQLIRGVGVERTLFEPEHELFRESYRKFLAQHAEPNHAAWEEQNIVDRSLWVEAGKQGFLGTAVPEEFGGGGVRDFRYNAII